MAGKNSQTCDYDTGTAASGPLKCGKPARYIWHDIDTREDRPVCGLHARMAEHKFCGEIRSLPLRKDG